MKIPLPGTKGLQWSAVREALRVLRPVLKGQKKSLVGLLLLTLGMTALELLRPWPIKLVFDQILMPGRAGTGLAGLTPVQGLLVAAGGALAISLLLAATSARMGISSARISRKATTRVRRMVFEHMHRLSVPWHQSSHSGDLLVRLMSDVNMVRDFLFASWVNLLARALLVLGVTTILLLLDPLFALLALAPLPLLGFGLNRSSRNLRTVAHKQRRREGDAAAFAAESLRHIRVVKAFAAEERATNTFARQSRSGERAGLKAAKIQARMGAMSEILTGAGVALVLFVGGRQVLTGALTPGDLLVFMSYARGLYKPVRKAWGEGARLSKATACAGRLVEILRVPSEDGDSGREAPAWQGRLALRDVSFRYPGGAEALDDLSLTLEAGQLALVTGPNGSGKSTLLSILLRLVTPDSGTVAIDGEEIRDFKLLSYRSRFAYVPQDLQLFSGSVRDNILYGQPHASEEEVVEASRAALFHEVALRLPEGYDTVLGEGGATLSGGEARRLMLARAAVRDARILLLDEPLSGLDAGAHGMVARAISRIAAGRTTLIVSHGHTGGLDPDVVVKLEHGRLQAMETPRSKVSSSNPVGTGHFESLGRKSLDVGDLKTLMSADGAAQLLGDAGLPVERAQPTYVRLKAGVAMVGYELHGRTRDGAPMMLQGYVRTSDRERAATLAQRWRQMRPAATPFGDGVILLPGGRSVLHLFPNDLRLRGLRFVASMEKLKRTLPELSDELDRGRISGRRSTLTTVRYKPERRYIARADLCLKDDLRGSTHRRETFLRFFPDARGADIERAARSLRRKLGAMVPRPIGSLFGGRLFVEEAVEGEDLCALVPSGGVDAGALCEAVVALHHSDVAMGPPRRPAGVLAEASSNLQMLAAMEPSLQSVAGALFPKLGASLPRERRWGTLHGDLHFHQFLAGPDGMVLVDFERGAMGDPLLDLGSLVAHLLALGDEDPRGPQAAHGLKDELVNDYMRSARIRGASDLDFFVACALVNRALLPFRRRREDWQGRAAASLERAEALLARRSKRPHSGPAAAPREKTAATSAQARSSLFQRTRDFTFYPRSRGPWPGWVEDAAASRAFGQYDPDTDGFLRIREDDDEALPALKRLLEHGRLVSYRPGHRATVRLGSDAAPAYAKVLRPDSARRLERHAVCALDLLRRAPLDFPRLAPLLERRPDDGVLVFGGLPGTPLHDTVMQTPTEVEHRLLLTARAMARFHEIPAPAIAVSRRSGLGLEGWAGLVADHFPEQWDSYAEALCLVDCLRGSDTDALGLVHGDLHDRNILVCGDRIALLDLDSLRKGSPADDIGNLAAHFILRALQRGQAPSAGRAHAYCLVRAYRKAEGRATEAAVHAAAAQSLFRLACVYRFRRRWQQTTRALLAESVRWSQSAQTGP